MIVIPSLPQHLNRMIGLHPWYGQLLAQRGIRPDDATLSALPLLTAALLESGYYKQGPPQTPESLSIYQTSGTSTGIRKKIYYSPEDDRHYMACKLASYREWLAASPSAVMKAFADVGTGHAAGTASAIFRELGLETEAISFSEPIEEHIARLTAFRPDLLYTMPSILEAIAAAAPDPQALGLRKIILVGEVAAPAWQYRMAQRFGVETEDILDTYGSIEIGAIASYSHRYGVYLFADGIHAEALPAEQLDPRFEPLEANEGVLVLTSCKRTMFPAIRYATYDVVRDFREIDIDGQRRQAFACISKRIGSDLKHGEKISLYDIENVVHAFVPNAEMRVRLRDNKLAVLIRSQALDADLLGAIQDAIEHKIAAIGQMIAGRMLERIEVTRVAADEPWEQGAVKSKKLYS
jgi:phenylacetate-CoA ligase